MTPREYETEGRLSRFSLDRRISVLVLFLTMLVVGSVAALRIPVELIPSGFTDSWLTVRIPWTDAPAREVMDKLTVPAEDELSTVRGLDNLISISLTGRAVVYLSFKQGTDMDVAYREVRDRIERARAAFPKDVDRITIGKDDASGIPVFMLGVALDPDLSDSYNLIQNEIILPLSRVDGVATVSAEGLVEKEILIELDREKTDAAGLNIYELARELEADNFSMASGTVREGPRKLLLRSVAKYDTLEQLEQRRIGPVRLGEVARISYEAPERDFRVRAMSKPAVAVAVMKEGEANVRQVSRDVARTVETIKSNPRLASTEMITLFSQGDTIDEALSTLLGSGMIGGLIAGCVLFLFLRRFRLTLIIALGIPLSLLIGLTVMFFSGESLNLLTLLGLMLCVGLLVDTSVVVAENIHRLHREGMERRQAAIKGAGEVALAITMSTLTTIVVFLPVSLVQGPGQFFLLRLAIPVCVSVAASLLVALVFIPLCVYITLPVNGRGREGLLRRAHGRVNDVLRAVYEWTFGRLNRGYNKVLALFLRRRFDLVLLLIVVFAVSGALPFQKVKFTDVQEEERQGFYIGVEMPASTTIEEAEEWFLKAEQVVEGMKDELGLDGWFLFHRKTVGELQGWFTQPRTVHLTASQATERVLKKLPRKPGFKFTVGRDRDTADDKGNSTWGLIVKGEDAEQLDRVSNEIEDLLCKVDGVLGPKSGTEQMPNELALVVDRERSQRYGVNPQVIAGVVGYALRGASLPKFHQNGKEIPVRVRYQEKDRESLTELADFAVPTDSGGFIPLSSLVDSKVLPTSDGILRRNKEMAWSINLELEKGREEETRRRLNLISANIDLPEGVTLGDNGRQQDLDEDLAAMKMAGLLSVVFIYLLMGFLFESFILPLSIVLTIPLSSLGVWWIHFLTGYNIDFLGVVALILLVGVVVNNGIVLIDYVNRLRNRGYARRDALLTATDRRFRPIMMTAITTIGGMVPLAFAGANSIGLSYTSFSLALIGGMTTATLLTLLVVPVFYTFFDDAREAVAQVVRRVFGRRSRARLGTPAPAAGAD